jgi:hypothetical protein
MQGGRPPSAERLSWSRERYWFSVMMPRPSRMPGWTAYLARSPAGGCGLQLAFHVGSIDAQCAEKVCSRVG